MLVHRIHIRKLIAGAGHDFLTFPGNADLGSEKTGKLCRTAGRIGFQCQIKVHLPERGAHIRMEAEQVFQKRFHSLDGFRIIRFHFDPGITRDQRYPENFLHPFQVCRKVSGKDSINLRSAAFNIRSRGGPGR